MPGYRGARVTCQARRWAARGTTTPTPGARATCGPRSTSSPSRRTPTGLASWRPPPRSSATSRPSPRSTASTRTSSSGPECDPPPGARTRPCGRWSRTREVTLLSRGSCIKPHVTAVYHSVSVPRVTAAGQGVLRSRFLISACGALHQPALPQLPGIQTFAGPSFHSAHWDHGVDIAGKKVGITSVRGAPQSQQQLECPRWG